MAHVTMFSFHLSYALELLGGLFAAYLIVLSRHWGPATQKLGTWLGGLGLTGAVLAMACNGYYGWAYWKEGIFAPKTVAASESAMSQMMSMHSPRDAMHRMWTCSHEGQDFETCVGSVMPGH